MRKKILMFLQSEVGGAERVTITIGKNLSKEQFSVFFYSVGPWENKVLHFIPTGMFRHHIKTSNPIKQLFGMWKAIKTENPDIIFSSVLNINTKLLLLRFLLPQKKIIIRSDNNFNVFSKKQQFMIRHLYPKANIIIAQTDEMKDGFSREGHINESKILVLSNPVDIGTITERLNGAISPYHQTDGKVFVASGRFAKAKGFDILVKAFALVKKEIFNAELYIVGRTGEGENKYYDTVKSIIEENNLSESIHCIGFQDNPYPYIKYADCFVLSSRYEGLPNVLLEALYLNRPVAATTCIPVISRLIQNGVNGFTADPENPESLATAMKNAIALKNANSICPPTSNDQFQKLFYD